MTTKIAHSSKRPNSNNRAAKRNRKANDISGTPYYVLWVLGSRVTYRGSTKANRARIRLGRTNKKNDELFKMVLDLHPNINICIRPSSDHADKSHRGGSKRYKGRPFSVTRPNLFPGRRALLTKE